MRKTALGLPRAVDAGKRASLKRKMRMTCRRWQVTYREDKRACIGTLPCAPGLIRTMLARVCGARDVAVMLRISPRKVLKTPAYAKCGPRPKPGRYDRLEIDEFRTFAG